MNYKKLLKLIEGIGKSAGCEVMFNEYNFTTMQDIKYPALLVFNTQSQITQNINTHTFQFIWADRLMKNGSNWIDVQSEGYLVLSNIINTIRSKVNTMDYTDFSLNSFKEQYADLLAGCSATIDISIPSELGQCYNVCDYEDKCL